MIDDELNTQLEKLRQSAMEEVHELAAAVWQKELYFLSMKDIIDRVNKEPEKYARISAYFAARKILLGDENATDKELLSGG